MPKETLKNLKETNERGKVKMGEMLKNKKRNNINSISSNNSCTFNTSRSQYKLNIRKQWNNTKKQRCKKRIWTS